MAYPRNLSQSLRTLTRECLAKYCMKALTGSQDKAACYPPSCFTSSGLDHEGKYGRKEKWNSMDAMEIVGRFGLCR